DRRSDSPKSDRIEECYRKDDGYNHGSNRTWVHIGFFGGLRDYSKSGKKSGNLNRYNGNTREPSIAEWCVFHSRSDCKRTSNEYDCGKDDDRHKDELELCRRIYSSIIEVCDDKYTKDTHRDYTPIDRLTKNCPEWKCLEMRNE